MTRSELLDVAILLQEQMKMARAKQMEDEAENDPDDSAAEFWKGTRHGLSIAHNHIQMLLARHA